MVNRPITLPLLTGPQTQARVERGPREGSDRSARFADGRLIDARFTVAESRQAAARVAGHRADDRALDERGSTHEVDGVTGRSLFLERDDGFDREAGATPSSTYMAQHITQELLPDGLYIDPHPAGIAAYRDVLSVLAARTTGSAGFDLQV